MRSRSSPFHNHGWSLSSCLAGMALLLVCPMAGGADLQWDTTRIELSATAGDQEVIAEFPFRNQTPRPITITRIEVSCDCTKATASASVIPAGQSGSVRATFTLGDRTGRQQKTIDVTTDVAPTDPTTLILRVNIADVVTGTPRMLIWKLHEPPHEKVMELQPVGAHVLNDIDPPGETPGFSCRLVSDASTKTFRLHLTPVSTDAPVSAVIQLIADVEGRPPTAFAVYALVK